MSLADSNTLTYEKVLWDEYPHYYNQSNYGSNGYLQCYCKQINYVEGTYSLPIFAFY